MKQCSVELHEADGQERFDVGDGVEICALEMVDDVRVLYVWLNGELLAHRPLATLKHLEGNVLVNADGVPLTSTAAEVAASSATASAS